MYRIVCILVALVSLACLPATSNATDCPQFGSFGGFGAFAYTPPPVVFQQSPTFFAFNAGFPVVQQNFVVRQRGFRGFAVPRQREVFRQKTVISNRRFGF